jgi:hypothetical protein
LFLAGVSRSARSLNLPQTDFRVEINLRMLLKWMCALKSLPFGEKVFFGVQREIGERKSLFQKEIKFNCCRKIAFIKINQNMAFFDTWSAKADLSITIRK